MTLEVKQEKAIAAYNDGDEETKKLLEKLFGKDKVCPKITDRVKTFEDACEVLGIPNSINLPDVTDCEEEDAKAITAFAKLSIIRRALNEGWKPNYSDNSQYKYYPWFKWTAGSGFSFFDFVCDYAGSNVGARLSFKSSELAKYAAEQFIDLYRDFLTL
jgi:hypothetical protein